MEQIRSGYFATICKGLWMFENESMLVAVKKLRENASEMGRVRFLQEAAIMGQFWHPSVVSLHGVVTVGEPVSYTTHSYFQPCLTPAVSRSVGICPQWRLAEVLEECKNHKVKTQPH